MMVTVKGSFPCISLRVDDSPGVVFIVSIDDGFSCCYEERKNFMLVECRQMNVKPEGKNNVFLSVNENTECELVVFGPWVPW